MKKAAIYVRVSTNDKGQDVNNQIIKLKEYSQNRGWQVYSVYSDNESGKKGRRERQAFNRLFTDAHKRKFDIVLFWALDRFSREGTFKTMAYLNQLDSAGIRFVSYTEEYLNTDNELVATILISIMSTFAKLEAQKISERTKAGLDRARKQGKKLGRRSFVEQGIDTKIKALSAQGLSDTEIMKELKISRNTVKKYK